MFVSDCFWFPLILSNMSGKQDGSHPKLRKRITPPRVGKIRKLKKARSSKPNAFLPAQYSSRFPPDGVMNHRVILEIPSWTRRKLDKWLDKLRVEKGIESSVDLSTNDRVDLPLLSRPIMSAPGREFEMVLGSNPTSPQLVDDDSPGPQIGSSAGEKSTGQFADPKSPSSDRVNSSRLSDLPLVLTISSSEDDS